MAEEEEAPDSELTREDLRRVYSDSGEAEKELMRELVNSDVPRQGIVLAEILHYFPGTSLHVRPVDED